MTDHIKPTLAEVLDQHVANVEAGVYDDTVDEPEPDEDVPDPDDEAV